MPYVLHSPVNHDEINEGGNKRGRNPDDRHDDDHSPEYKKTSESSMIMLRKNHSEVAQDKIAIQHTNKLSIAVNCVNPSVAHKVLNAHRSRDSPLTYSQLDISQTLAITTANGMVCDFRIFVSELLPSKIFRLLGQSESKLRKLNFRYVWARNGIIHVKKSDGSLRHTIMGPNDIDRIIELSTTPCTTESST